MGDKTYLTTGLITLWQGIFAGEVGVPRLLKLLDKYQIKATWFIPGRFRQISTMALRNDQTYQVTALRPFQSRWPLFGMLVTKCALISFLCNRVPPTAMFQVVCTGILMRYSTGYPALFAALILMSGF